MNEDKMNINRRTSRYNATKPNVSDSTPLGKKRPYDIELEQAVLGALMLEKDALNDVIEILKPESFDLEAHQRIYKAILALFAKSEPIDLLTVTAQLRSSGELDIAKGAIYITQLTQRVNSAANIEYHARLLLQYSIKRELINISNQIQRDSYEETSDVFELLDKMEQALFEVSEMNIRKNFSGMSSIMSDAIAELESMRDQVDGLTGVPSGFSSLDRITSGWQKSDLIILAGRPGMGKTAFVLSSLRNAAVDFGKPSAIFSLEMSSVQLVKRLISAEAELDSSKLKTGKLSEHEWKKLVDKTAKLSEAPIFIDDTPALSILELRAKCRRLKAQHDIQMVIIDYLQLMAGESGKNGNREQEIAMISRSLKQLAKELNIPVIALSQLSRAVETRGGDKRPQLSDLRESGSIEQDADMVIFLYRPEYYGITEDEEGVPVTGTGEVMIEKNRHGATERVRLKFIGKYTKFTDWESDDFGGNDFIPGFGENDFMEDPGNRSSIIVGSKINNQDKGARRDDPPF
ncbi:replicative DNA helicase [Chondrinema litorale]|uniref:replicative DNA helicase n=1 Tax=Chondrinema litorale TaxID=2994555 RepID=UPI00254400A7|nr:replicative DNA helicase [Chondrinema litorale]UZR93051.1 replicative DNA helicase [Chondrinema litorale]